MRPFTNDQSSDEQRGRGRLAPVLVHGAFLATLLALLAVVGQPIFTDDLWWHLALGRTYGSLGPWLESDPLLFTAPGPPTPASWLSDVLLHGTLEGFGFTGLRLLHALLVAGICAAVWRLLAKCSRSPLIASLGSMIVIGVATYRLVQLRPHLVTMLLALLLALLLVDAHREMSRRRTFMLVVLFAAWVNLHAGFVLGLAMLGVVVAGGLALDIARWGRPSLGAISPRSRGLVVAALMAAVATLLNPGGYAPHIAYFIAGEETPALARVGDEWSRVALFSRPARVDLADWLGSWIAIVATASGWFALVRRANATATTIALGMLSLLACGFALMAVRFSWLCVFPLAFAAMTLPLGDIVGSRRGRSAAVAASLLLLFAYLQFGSWPVFSRALGPGYASAYAPARYQAHAVWWLADSGLGGPLFAEYSQSGFISHWLAPRIKTLINGSLNVRASAIEANLPLRERRGTRPDERFVELLDREGIELFLGIRLPQAKPTPRPWFHTTAHLEDTRGWVPVFRNLDSAVYLRDVPSNDANFEKVSSYFAAQGIPFDRERGFDVEAAISNAPKWAIARGLIPPFFDRLVTTARSGPVEKALESRILLAELYAALGLYSSAIELDRESREQRPDDAAIQRRLVWSLLRERRLDEARAQARAFASQAPVHALDHRVIAVAIAAAGGELQGERLDSSIATLPVFGLGQANRLVRWVTGPEVRLR